MKFLTLTFVLLSNLSLASDYVLADNYQTKLHTLWDYIASTEYTGQLPTASPNLFNMLRPSYLIKTLTHSGDTLPEGRKKLIHTYGSVAAIQFVPTTVYNVPFTGLAKEGAYGLMRASLATMSGSFTPGIALKFPITGRSSVDVIAMFSVDGQEDNRNFFENSFKNEIKKTKNLALLPLQLAFVNTAKMLGHMQGKKLNPLALDISEFGNVNQDGQNFPYQDDIELLTFSPLSDVRALIDPNSQNDFRVDLAKIPAGTVLYEVFAKRHLKQAYRVGYIVLKSRFIASQFGDEQLFFAHELQAE